jgi:hypothetical protein
MLVARFVALSASAAAHVRFAGTAFAIAGTAAAFTACSLQAPATQNPLRDELAAAENMNIEQATRACLSQSGWKVDPIGGVSSGANVVTAYKAKVGQTDVYIYPPSTTPRITGGPENTDVFWKCLGRELASGGHASSATDPGPDPGAGQPSASHAEPKK